MLHSCGPTVVAAPRTPTTRFGWETRDPGWRSVGCATAKPWQHRADPQLRRARAHANRVMTAHPVEVAARARRNREGSPSGSSFRGNHRWCAASCALSLRRYRSRFAAAVLQVHVRGRLGEILPGPAAPSPDAATLCRPRKPASRRHIAATGHDWPLRRIRARPSAGDGLVAPRCTDPAGPGPGRSHCCDWP